MLIVQTLMEQLAQEDPASAGDCPSTPTCGDRISAHDLLGTVIRAEIDPRKNCEQRTRNPSHEVTGVERGEVRSLVSGETQVH